MGQPVCLVLANREDAEMFDTVVNVVRQHAERMPDQPAVLFKNEVLSFRELSERSAAVGALLAGMGIKRGDRVLYTALSKPETVVMYLGIQFAGGIAVAMDKNATPQNAWGIYEDTDASLYLTDKPMKGYEDKCRLYSFKELYAKACDADTSYEGCVMPDPEDIAEMIFTTGTTGKPKGVMLSYRAVYHISMNCARGIGITGQDRVLVPLPLHHSLALREVRAALLLGGSVVLQNGFTFARELEKNITQLNCTGMVTVPASFELTRSQMQDKFSEVVGKLRYIEVGAGSLSVRQRKDFAALLPDTDLNNTWGSSETGGALFTKVSRIAADADHPERVGCIGKALDGLTALALDVTKLEELLVKADKLRSEHSDKSAAEVEELLSAEVEKCALTKTDAEHPGRLALKGDMVMSGYWNRPEATADALRGGWLVTNDMVYFDADGYAYMLGRSDDIINVGGEKVSPIEVENIASEFPAMKECACIGAPDPEEVLGQIPVLFMVTQKGFSLEELKTYLAGHMERFKIPQAFVEVPALPRNRMKKLDRKEMRRLWEVKSSGKEKELNNPVIDAILSRRSIRKFTDAPVPQELLEMVLKAGYYAPSGHNMQTWQFTVVRTPDQIAELKEAALEAAKKEKVLCYGFENPACLILVSNDNRNKNSAQDASCAAENMLLAAHSYGLGAVWLNVLKTLREVSPVKEVLDAFGVPENHTVWSMVALGYPAEEGKAIARKETVVRYVAM